MIFFNVMNFGKNFQKIIEVAIKNFKHKKRAAM